MKRKKLNLMLIFAVLLLLAGCSVDPDEQLIPGSNSDSLYPDSALGRNAKIYAYTIQQKFNGQYLDAYEDAIHDYSVVTKAEQNNDTQRWLFTYAGFVYALKQVSSGNFLDAFESSSNGYNVVLRGWQNDDSQFWYSRDYAGGHWRLQQVSTGRYLHADPTSSNGYSAVTKPSYPSNENQRWAFKRVINSFPVEYYIVHKRTGMFLDAYTNSNDNSAFINTYQSDNTQRWKSKFIGFVYKIRQKSSGRFLDAYTSSSQNYSAFTNEAEDNDTQLWFVRKIGTNTNTYTVQQIRTGKYLDAYTKSNDCSAFIEDEQSNNTQCWIIKCSGS